MCIGLARQYIADNAPLNGPQGSTGGRVVGINHRLNTLGRVHGVFITDDIVTNVLNDF